MSRPSDYVVIRAYGEIHRRLPLEIQADQNVASLIGAPRDAAWIDDDGLVRLIYEVNDPLMRTLTEMRSRELFADAA